MRDLEPLQLKLGQQHLESLEHLGWRHHQHEQDLGSLELRWRHHQHQQPQPLGQTSSLRWNHPPLPPQAAWE